MKTKILVIADELSIRDLANQSCFSEGFHIYTTSSGVGPVFQLFLAQPDLIIIELPQPVTEGTRSLQQIRELSSVPVIALTPQDDYEARINYLNHGADQCMTRPVDTRELEARARALLRREQVRRTTHRAFECFAAEGG